MTERADTWEALFAPRTVAVVGASSDPRRIGGRLVRYSVEAGFQGRIVPVTRRPGPLYGLETISDLTQIDDAPDLVVIAVGRADVPQVVRQAVAVGAKNIVVVAAGFAEQDAAGRELQLEIAQVAGRAGVRLLGPNSNGIMNVADGAFFAFTPVIDSARPLPGEIAIATQSAAIGTYFLNYAHTIGMGISHWVHTGNESDVTVLDVTRSLIDPRRTRAIALSYEVMRDPASLRRTLLLAAETDTVIAVLRVGTSPDGRRAAMAHTAAMVEDDADVVASLLGDAGVFVGETVQAVVDYLQAATHRRRATVRPRLGLVTTSGGIGVLMADAAERVGVDMPVFSPGLQRRLTEIAPFCHPANPVDTTAQTINEPQAFQEVLRECIRSGEVDLLGTFVAHGLGGVTDVTFRQVVTAATAARNEETGTAGLFVVGLLTPEACRELQQLGVSVFREPAFAAAAFGSLARCAQLRERFLARMAAAADGQAGHQAHEEITPPDGGYTGASAKDLLARLGAQVPDRAMADSPHQAAAAARRIGFPVAVKLESPSIPHKAAADALVLNVHTPARAEAAYRQLDTVRAGLEQPERALADVHVEAQLTGAEAFLGLVRHRDYGLLVAVGAGGGVVEQERAIDWCWYPVDQATVASALRRYVKTLPGGSRGVDGQHARSVTELAKITATAMDALGKHASVIECNPVLLLDDGRAVAVDALVQAEPDHTADTISQE